MFSFFPLHRSVWISKTKNFFLFSTRSYFSHNLINENENGRRRKCKVIEMKERKINKNFRFVWPISRCIIQSRYISRAGIRFRDRRQYLCANHRAQIHIVRWIMFTKSWDREIQTSTASRVHIPMMILLKTSSVWMEAPYNRITFLHRIKTPV